MSDPATPKQNPIVPNNLGSALQTVLSGPISLVRSVFSNASLPYIVVGYGCEKNADKTRADFFRQKDGMNSLYAHESGELEELIRVNSKFEDSEEFELPWSAQKLDVQEYEDEVQLEMPPNSLIIGRVTCEECISPNEDFRTYHFKGKKHKTVELSVNGTSEIKLRNVIGIIFPKRISRSNRMLCKPVKPPVHLPENHYVHTLIGLSETCKLVKFGENSPVKEEQNRFELLYHGYDLVSKEDEDSVIHEHYYFKSLPLGIDWSSSGRFHMNHVGIKIYFPYAPYVIGSLALVSFSLPGIFQYFGSRDNGWGDVVNEVIGSGSVLLGFICLCFLRWFNADIASEDAMHGKFYTTNDRIAKTLAPATVKEIEEMACDPRLSEGLIARRTSSAVRTKRDGWLYVGKEIHFTDMRKHGYAVFKDQPLVLDLVTCKFYKVCTKLNSARIVRHKLQFKKEEFQPLSGNELFSFRNYWMAPGRSRRQEKCDENSIANEV